MNFEAKVKYEKLDPLSGKNKVISETYLLDAESFGDAEVKTLKYMAEITPSTVVATIKKSNIECAIADTESGVFYKATIKQSVIDDISGKESTKTIYILIGDEEIDPALIFTEDWCTEGIYDSEIIGINKSPIVGIF